MARELCSQSWNGFLIGPFLIIFGSGWTWLNVITKLVIIEWYCSTLFFFVHLHCNKNIWIERVSTQRYGITRRRRHHCHFHGVYDILLEEVPVVKLYFGDWTLIRLIGSFLAGQVRSLLLVGVLEGELAEASLDGVTHAQTDVISLRKVLLMKLI